MGVEVQRLSHRLAGILLSHELRNTINQNVFVMDGCESPDTWRNLDHDIAVFIAQYPRVRLSGEREDRMLHACHVILRNGIEHVADEQVVIGVALREEGGL